jgi:hypothetical protein
LTFLRVLNTVGGKTAALEREKRVSTLTLNAVDELPNGTNTYRAVGNLNILLKK